MLTGRHHRLGQSLVALIVVATGCARDIAEPASDHAAPAAYAAVLDEFVPPGNDEDPPVVFLVSLGEPIALDDQVAIIDAIGDGREVEFVDDPEVVIDDDSVERLPVDSGVLVGIGTIPREPPYTVRVEVYRSQDAVEGYLVMLSRRDERWLVESTEVVTPEVLAREQ